MRGKGQGQEPCQSGFRGSVALLGWGEPTHGSCGIPRGEPFFFTEPGFCEKGLRMAGNERQLMKEQMHRRTFLRAAALGAVALGGWVGRAAQVGQAVKKIKLGLIGCGGYGLADARAAFKAGGVEVMALCDVDSEHLSRGAAEIEKLQGARPLTFKLCQELLDTPGLEAVIIASPPQWHALHFIAATEKGLDIYCEKPLAYDIREGRAMVGAAQRSGRVVQVGFQRRQSKAFQQVRDRLQQGKAGRVVSVDAQIHYTAGIKDTKPQDPPPSLDWDLWCGPAPHLPYSPQIGHVNWRLEKTTGHGHLVDWGIHLVDAVRFVLRETAPQSVQASGGLYHLKDKITTPDTLTAHFQFASCPLTWRHRIWGAEEYAPEVSNGVFFYAEKETIFVTDDRWIVIPKGRNKERQINEVKGDLGVEHMAEFLNAVRERRQPGCGPEEAQLSTTAVKLAMISYEVGTPITWSAAREEVLGNRAANKLLKREYRSPWRHPYGAASSRR
jgi:predicted dehydrogenase